MKRPMLFLFSAILWLNAAVSVEGAKPIVELTVGDESYAGRTIAHNQEQCWLLQSDGRLQQLELSEVSTFRKLPGQFASMTGVDLRNRLQKEMGHSFDVVGTEHYVVCAAKGHARAYAALFEETYRSCRQYFQVRGLTIEPLEFPLVGIVLPTQREFAEYMQKEGNRYTPGLLGYYSPTTNRCVLYQHGESVALNDNQRMLDFTTQAHRSNPTFATDALTGRRSSPMFFVGGSEKNSIQDTIIHEGMHQVAFNLGVHSRCGDDPRWVIEGLATVFEAPGIRARSNSIRVRINHERFLWFGDYLKNRRQEKSLATFIASDHMFETATLDAYAQSWALTFYLLETRSSQFAKYLKRLSERDPLQNVSTEDRLADFHAEFGKDIDWLEVEMERFFKKLN
ncbi:MAG: DUF1570 domain-containing protein [Planctomycetota bacterium]|nr:DUF1570 domain-containing protein [Planctomycetota bacterium]MDA1211336.1 DUF1570 domain-containing protein [Planctomycetota bacterium]